MKSFQPIFERQKEISPSASPCHTRPVIVVAATRLSHGQSQGPGTQSRSARWEAGDELLEPPLLPQGIYNGKRWYKEPESEINPTRDTVTSLLTACLIT